MTIEQLTDEFELARPQLKSYILRITASVNDAEDIVQDTFIKSSQKINLKLTTPNNERTRPLFF
jgi:DNA-directed RNA polymerase specialized sigma24 family protein